MITTKMTQLASRKLKSALSNARVKLDRLSEAEQKVQKIAREAEIPFSLPAPLVKESQDMCQRVARADFLQSLEIDKKATESRNKLITFAKSVFEQELENLAKSLQAVLEQINEIECEHRNKVERQHGAAIEAAKREKQSNTGSLEIGGLFALGCFLTLGAWIVGIVFGLISWIFSFDLPDIIEWPIVIVAYAGWAIIPLSGWLWWKLNQAQAEKDYEEAVRAADAAHRLKLHSLEEKQERSESQRKQVESRRHKVQAALAKLTDVLPKS